MLVDLRIYTYHPSRFRTFLKSYEEFGFALTTRHLGRTLGIFRSDSGTMNRTFQFFVYEDAAHRDRCRGAMLTDPEWGKFVKIDGDALLTQHNELLVPTAFSPFASVQGPWPEASPRTRVFELRRWHIRTDAMDAALDALAGATPSLDRLIPDTIGYFEVITGAECQVMMLSAYPDALNRNQTQAALRGGASPLAEFRRNVLAEDSSLLLPMGYSPLA